MKKVWFSFDRNQGPNWLQHSHGDDFQRILTQDTGIHADRSFSWMSTGKGEILVFNGDQYELTLECPDAPRTPLIHVPAGEESETFRNNAGYCINGRPKDILDDSLRMKSGGLQGNPNDVQVGGTHYKSAQFQPWDWPLYGLGYYETNTIKYITRFRSKNGIEDLQKALHYIDKMIYHTEQGVYGNGCSANNLHVLEYNRQNTCDRWQSMAIHLLVQWSEVKELQEARKIVEELIQCQFDEQSKVELVVPAPAPEAMLGSWDLAPDEQVVADHLSEHFREVRSITGETALVEEPIPAEARKPYDDIHF